jgi:hypothetical protein
MSLKHDSSADQTPSFTSKPPQYQYRESSGSYPSSSPPTASSDISASDQAFLSQALEFTRHTGPVTSRIRKLESPIAIPQTTPGIGKSFLRAWAPTLQYHDMTVVDFMAFVDNLNVVSTASPPLQVLDLAGGLVGMVPHHWAKLAGLALQGSAKLGTALVSKGRTEIYMREVNETMFKPRGLKVSLASTEAIRAVFRMPANRPTLAPLTAETMTISMVDRALIEVEPYNAVLDLNVPPPTAQITTLAKLSAKQVIAQDKKNQTKILKKREKATKKDEEQREKDEKKDEERRRKEEKKEGKRREKEKKDKKHGKGKGRVSSDFDSDEIGGMSDTRIHYDEKGIKGKKGESKEQKNEDKEEKNAGKLLWIMIEGL